MKVYIGADHRGYDLKERIKKWMDQSGVIYEDMGAYEKDSGDDYTLYAQKVALMVRDKKGSRGILLCGSGVGVDVVSNKFDGIRASIGKNTDQVASGRRDDNMNILVLAADYTNDDDSYEMVKVFLGTAFSGKYRHKKRLRDIKKIEANN